MDIVIIGSISRDILVRTELFPKTDQESFCTSYNSVKGGGGANVAFFLSELFPIDTYLATCVGDDETGEDILREVEHSKLKPDYVKRLNGIQSTRHIMVSNKNEERITYVYSGAMSKFSFRLFPDNFIKNHSNIYLAPVNPKIAEDLVEILRGNDVNFFFNPGSAFFRNHKELNLVLSMTQTLILNEKESKLYSEEESLPKAAEFFFQKGVEVVVITLGEKGAAAYINDAYFYEESFKTRFESSIGCGDAFSAGYVGATISGLSIKRALKFANALGGFVAARKDMREELPKRFQIDQILQRDCLTR